MQAKVERKKIIVTGVLAVAATILGATGVALNARSANACYVSLGYPWVSSCDPCWDYTGYEQFCDYYAGGGCMNSECSGNTGGCQSD
jgi:hypothetical protein